MRSRVKTLLKRSGWPVSLLALTAFVSGCQTYRTVDERFMSQPAPFKRVQVLPIWFAGAGDVDGSLTTNDVQVLCRKVGENSSAAIRQTLLAKGYEVAGPVRVLSGNATTPGLDSEDRDQLEAARDDFCRNLLRSCSLAPSSDGPLVIRTTAKQNPFHYQMAPALTNLLVSLGATNATAVLLVDSKVFFESRHKQTKRVWWNWTGGGLLAATEVGANLALWTAAALSGSSSPPPPVWIDPFWHSSNSAQHTIALVDARTREVLWFNRQDFKRKDPRDSEILKTTVADALADLPSLRGHHK